MRIRHLLLLLIATTGCSAPLHLPPSERADRGLYMEAAGWGRTLHDRPYVRLQLCNDSPEAVQPSVECVFTPPGPPRGIVERRAALLPYACAEAVFIGPPSPFRVLVLCEFVAPASACLAEEEGTEALLSIPSAPGAE